MKKLLAFLLFVSLSFSSCYIEDEYPCYDSINYSYYNINKFYSPATIRVYFNLFCPQNNGYYLLVNDQLYGTEFINGKWWKYVSNMHFNSPIITYVDGNSFLPFRTYRCLIVSTSGINSQEFNLSTY